MHKSPTILMPSFTQCLSLLSGMRFGIFWLFQSGAFLKNDPVDIRIKWVSWHEIKVVCIIEFFFW